MSSRKRFKQIICHSFICASTACSAPAAPTTVPSSPRTLVWQDEFSAPAIDHAKWAFDKGNGFWIPDAKIWISGWGNNERQYYTDRAENAYVKDGMLHIRALREKFEKCEFTSARLTTKGLFSRTYGRFEFRAKLPVGKGIWPALWMLPAENAYGGWASSGEIDIMEARGQLPQEVLGTLHFGSQFPHNEHATETFRFPQSQGIDDFHVYALEWEREAVRWYVDDRLYSEQKKWWSTTEPAGKPKGQTTREKPKPNPWPAPFDKPFYIVMNLAIGGNFAGDPDKNTMFPVEMIIDYLRVYGKRGQNERQ